MDFRQLKALVTVAEAGSVTGAADVLHLVQPAVTRRIRTLEEEPGVALVERTRQGMRPTEAGEVLVERARRALAMLELPRRHQPRERVRSLIHRLHSPAFAGEPLSVLGTPSLNGAEPTVASARESRHASARVVFA